MKAYRTPCSSGRTSSSTMSMHPAGPLPAAGSRASTTTSRAPPRSSWPGSGSGLAGSSMSRSAPSASRSLGAGAAGMGIVPVFQCGRRRRHPGATNDPAGLARVDVTSGANRSMPTREPLHLVADEMAAFRNIPRQDVWARRGRETRPPTYLVEHASFSEVTITEMAAHARLP